MATIIGMDEEWIVRRTGVRERRIARCDQSASDLGAAACVQALREAGLKAQDIDLVVVATTTPDLVFPATACLVQARLGIDCGAAFDVQAVSTGFIYALTIVDSLIRTGVSRRALVVGVDVISRLMNWSDPRTCILFGDGAGAVVLASSAEPGILRSRLSGDGSRHHLLYALSGASSNQAPRDMQKAHIEMQGSEVFKASVMKLSEVADEILDACNLRPNDIDWLIPHQANLRSINAAAKKLQIPLERVIVTIDKHGNTSAASVPLALDAAIRDGRIKKGDTLLLEAFGAGFTWGAAAVIY